MSLKTCLESFLYSSSLKVSTVTTVLAYVLELRKLCSMVIEVEILTAKKTAQANYSSTFPLVTWPQINEML